MSRRRHNPAVIASVAVAVAKIDDPPPSNDFSDDGGIDQKHVTGKTHATQNILSSCKKCSRKERGI